jgi:pimeloyl-ACP methyl ester carboxylesterase
MKPIVLVHGMYFGGWCWRKVAAPLRAAGHTVYAPSLTGCGDRVHLSRPGITIDTLGQDIANLLRYEDLRDVVLVSTSTGGMAMARAAELEPDRIGHLLLVDALIPFAGTTAYDTVPAMWKPIWEEGTISETQAIESSAASVQRLLEQLDPDDADAVLHRRTTFPRAPMFEPVDLHRFWQGGWPATVVYCQRTHNPPQDVQRRAADLLKAEWLTLDSAHLPFFTHPQELAEIIAARAS